MLNKNGIKLGDTMEEFGMNIASQIWPEFSWSVILSVVVIIILLVALVSYIAAKRISGMNIVRILKGK
jgi:ABC-type antimicrobial peptide transport system permease subunit